MLEIFFRFECKTTKYKQFIQTIYTAMLKKGNDEGVEEGFKCLKERIENSIKLAKEKTINDKSLAYKLQREFT